MKKHLNRYNDLNSALCGAEDGKVLTTIHNVDCGVCLRILWAAEVDTHPAYGEH